MRIRSGCGGSGLLLSMFSSGNQPVDSFASVSEASRKAWSASKRVSAPRERAGPTTPPAATAAEITVSWSRQWMELSVNVSISNPAVPLGNDRARFSLQRVRWVTLMRHLFLQPATILFLTHFVIQPAGCCFLIPRACRTNVFCACQRCTRRAVPVSTVTTPADVYDNKTTMTLENPAVL